jgi:hypothetical protein
MNKISLNIKVFCDPFPDRAIKIVYFPWAITGKSCQSAANQIAPFAKTNACHIIMIKAIAVQAYPQSQFPTLQQQRTS